MMKMLFHQKPQFEAPSFNHYTQTHHHHHHYEMNKPRIGTNGYYVIDRAPIKSTGRSTEEMEILSRVYLGGIGLVGLLILYKIIDRK